MKRPLAVPSPTLIKKYVAKFEQLPDIAASDLAVSKAFQAFPRNDKIDEVLLKVSVLNSLYSTSIFALYKVAAHIHNLQIDAKLALSSLAVVGEIARIQINGKVRRNYSFSSKYCSWHVPDFYPIYDSYVEGLRWAYQQQDQFGIFGREELKHYTRYKTVHDQFRQHYGLTAFTAKQVDKFLWLYGKELK